jgi:hypothetical protein
MKAFFITLFLTFLLVEFIPGNAYCQTKPPSRQLALPGDTIGVVINYVKADKREQFERFLYKIFLPGINKLDPSYQKVSRQTRILHPVAPEQDGSYAYFFIMDPYLSYADYNIANLLTKMYGETAAKDHMKLFIDALASPGRMYTEVQGGQ